MTQQPIRKTSAWPVIIAVVFLLAFGVLFVSELLDVSRGGEDTPPIEETLTADTYQAEVERLLALGDPAEGEALITRYGCASCHTGLGAQNRLAPEFAGVGSRASTRRPPLSAAAYLYESILYSGVFEVEGYTASMPIIYDRLIPEADFGSIIAYLLTLMDGDS